MPEITFKRGWVYEFLIRFEPDYQNERKKFGVCLQDDKIAKDWDAIMFARTHSYKDAKLPVHYEWDVYVSPQDSNSEFGVKIVCNELLRIKKSKVCRMVYELPRRKVEEMNAKLWWALGMQP
ncbi:MAG: hypothetical protein WBW16_02445 [Bacteroidota bacterium]